MGVEMDAFRFVEGGQSNWTNFFNRLRIIFLEDIGLANPQLFLSIDERLSTWKEEKDISTGMLSIINDMALSNHSRYFSHVRNKFKNGVKECPSNDIKEGFLWCIENKHPGICFFIDKLCEMK